MNEVASKCNETGKIYLYISEKIFPVDNGNAIVIFPLNFTI